MEKQRRSAGMPRGTSDDSVSPVFASAVQTNPGPPARTGAGFTAVRGRPLAPLLLLAVSAWFLAGFETAFAQSRLYEWSVGGFIGEPTAGVTLLGRSPNDRSVELLAGWDIDDYLHVSGRYLYESTLESTIEPIYLFWGPGVFVELRDRERRDEEAKVGVSVVGGLGVWVGRVDVYFQVGPYLSLLPDTSGRVGGGLGLRYRL